MISTQKLLVCAAGMLLSLSLLSQEPAFKFFSVGEVLPQGWLNVQIQQDAASGYARYLPQLTDRCHLDVFDVTDRDSMKSGKAGGEKGYIWWDGETTGNWFDGFIRTAYLSGDPEAMREADRAVEMILGFQESDGYLGTYPKNIRYESPLGNINRNNGELWSQACLYRGLIAYYELTGKQHVLEAVEKATRLTISMYHPDRPYWSEAVGQTGPGHNMMFIDVCEGLFRITGKKVYLDFMRFMYDSWNDVGDKTASETDQLLRNLAKPDLLLNIHGAHVMEHIRAPYALYYSDHKKYEVAYNNWFPKVEKHLAPGGACISDEHIRQRLGSPDIGAEYCAMFELMYSLQSAIEKSGNPLYGDMIEKLAFNAAQGARLKNGKGIQYLTRDNQKEILSKQHGRKKYIFSPTHDQAAVCCTPNSIRFYPYYVSNMWMRTADERGIAAITYGPSVLSTEVNGINVEILESTNYPFEERILFTVNPEEPFTFPILFREPQWAENTRIDAAGAEIERQNGFIRITKQWEQGDQVELVFGAEIEKHKSFQEELYFSRGPLVYSLGFEAELTSTRSYPVEGFYDMDAKPVEGAPLNYSNKGPSDFIFKKDGVDWDHPWVKGHLRLEGQLFNEQRQMIEKVGLVPYGTTLLRQTTFPVK